MILIPNCSRIVLLRYPLTYVITSQYDATKDFYCQPSTGYDGSVLRLDISSSFLSSLNDLRLLWNQDARKAFSPSCRVEILIICSKFDTAIIPSPGSPVLVISVMALTT